MLKTKYYIQLIKPRLSFFVVFSASISYLWSTNGDINHYVIWMLSIGGFFITAASNAFNQILEASTDGLMERTKSRPLPSGKINKTESILFASSIGLIGLIFLNQCNAYCFILGFIAMFLYIFIYTLLKKKSVFAVVPGAIAGSLPIVIGSVAASGYISTSSILLFLVQFIWQFPHTWSIAWLLNEDYKKAGIRMLPSTAKPCTNAIFILCSSFLTLPLGLVFFMYDLASIYFAFVAMFAGIIISIHSYKLYKYQDRQLALKVMLSSIFYLPFILLILLFDKFFL